MKTIFNDFVHLSWQRLGSFLRVVFRYLWIAVVWLFRHVKLGIKEFTKQIKRLITFVVPLIKMGKEKLQTWYKESPQIEYLRKSKVEFYVRIEKWLIRFFHLEHLELDRAGISHVKLGKPNELSFVILKAITALFVALFIWAALADVDDISHAEGRVIPSAKMQVIQNMEGGIVQSIEVRTGDRVDAGDLLVTLSPTQFASEFDSRNEQMMSLMAKSIRLLAEIDDKELIFPEELKVKGGEFITLEIGEHSNRRLKQKAELAVYENQLKNSLSELEIVTRLVERGLEPRLELIRNQSRAAEARAKLESQKRQYKAEASAELAKTMADLSPLQKSLPAIEDKFDRTLVRAPVNGVVNRVLVTTTGGIVKPGEPIVEIVPSDDLLVVEAKINPKDIGFVKLGQKAKIKLTAYDYSIFGGIEGQIVNISADAVSSEERGQQQYYYLARVETSSSMINSLGKKLPIIAGMQAQVDVITGHKTVLRYLLKPIIGVKENAFRER